MKLSLSISCLAVAVDAWTYNDFGEWATESPNCASTIANQSPIDIATSNPETTTAPLIFQGLPDSANYSEIKQQLVINGHTWELEWDIDNRAEEVYGVQYQAEGGELKIYKLLQFHFHSPSEHTIDGEHADFEAHLVHSCFGNITCETQDPDDELLVVSIMMNVGDTDHPYLASFWPEFKAMVAGTATNNGLMDHMANPYNSLVPPQPHDFYRYQGSTTTPSCVQNVEWFIMKTQTTLSQAQLTDYRTAITNHAGTQTLTSSETPNGVSAGWDVNLGTNNRQIQVTGDRVPMLYQSPAELAQQQRDFMWHGVLIFALCLAAGLCCLLAYTQLTKPKDKPKATRAVKPKPKPAAPAEEVPLVTPPAPPAPVPMLFTQPMQAPVTTFAAPTPQLVTPQLQMAQPQLMTTMAPQARPLLVAP